MDSSFEDTIGHLNQPPRSRVSENSRKRQKKVRSKGSESTDTNMPINNYKNTSVYPLSSSNVDAAPASFRNDEHFIDRDLHNSYIPKVNVNNNNHDYNYHSTTLDDIENAPEIIVGEGEYSDTPYDSAEDEWDERKLRKAVSTLRSKNDMNKYITTSMDDDTGNKNGSSPSQDDEGEITEGQEQYDPIMTTTPSVYLATQQPYRNEEPYIIGSLYPPSGGMLVLPSAKQHVEPNNQLFRKPHCAKQYGPVRVTMDNSSQAEDFDESDDSHHVDSGMYKKHKMRSTMHPPLVLPRSSRGHNTAYDIHNAYSENQRESVSVSSSPDSKTSNKSHSHQHSYSFTKASETGERRDNFTVENEVTFLNPDNDASELYNNYNKDTIGLDNNRTINNQNGDNAAMHLVQNERTRTLQVKDNSGSDYHYGSMYGLDKNNEHRMSDVSENNEEICNPLTINMNTGCRGKRDGRSSFPIGVGCSLSNEGGLAFAVQSEVTSPGYGELILTGKIGRSMKESCMVALTWAKHNYRKIAEWMNIGEGEEGLDLNTSDIDVHVNFPSCEAEKNGPSAGATIATSLVLLHGDALTLKPKVAISGEINLRGSILPIGNVREKVGAARHQGISDIILSSANIKQFKRLDEKVRGNLRAIKADHMMEVLKYTIKSKNGIDNTRSGALLSTEGMGIVASLACSNYKGKVQWVEACAISGQGRWIMTGNLQDGTTGSILVARTWVRKNVKEILKRLRPEWFEKDAHLAENEIDEVFGHHTTSTRHQRNRMNKSSNETTRKSQSEDESYKKKLKLDLCRMRNLVDDYDIDIHIHLPETEVAKDVSINGAAAAVALISLMTGIPARNDVAILGELTLAGILWPLEQVNEAEIYTARCGKIKHLIVPEENIFQLQRIRWDILEDLSVTGASYLLDVLHILLPRSSSRNEQIPIPINNELEKANIDKLPRHCIIQPIKDTGLIALLNPRYSTNYSKLGLTNTHGQAITGPPMTVSSTLGTQPNLRTLNENPFDGQANRFPDQITFPNEPSAQQNVHRDSYSMPHSTMPIYPQKKSRVVEHGVVYANVNDYNTAGRISSQLPDTTVTGKKSENMIMDNDHVVKASSRANVGNNKLDNQHHTHTNSVEDTFSTSQGTENVSSKRRALKDSGSGSDSSKKAKERARRSARNTARSSKVRNEGKQRIYHSGDDTDSRSSKKSSR